MIKRIFQAYNKRKNILFRDNVYDNSYYEDLIYLSYMSDLKTPSFIKYKTNENK